MHVPSLVMFFAAVCLFSDPVDAAAQSTGEGSRSDTAPHVCMPEVFQSSEGRVAPLDAMQAATVLNPVMQLASLPSDVKAGLQTIAQAKGAYVDVAVRDYLVMHAPSAASNEIVGLVVRLNENEWRRLSGKPLKKLAASPTMIEMKRSIDGFIGLSPSDDRQAALKDLVQYNTKRAGGKSIGRNDRIGRVAEGSFEIYQASVLSEAQVSNVIYLATYLPLLVNGSDNIKVVRGHSDKILKSAAMDMLITQAQRLEAVAGLLKHLLAYEYDRPVHMVLTKSVEEILRGLQRFKGVIAVGDAKHINIVTLAASLACNERQTDMPQLIEQREISPVFKAALADTIIFYTSFLNHHPLVVEKPMRGLATSAQLYGDAYAFPWLQGREAYYDNVASDLNDDLELTLRKKPADVLGFGQILKP